MISSLKDVCELGKMGKDLLKKHYPTETEKELLRLAALSGEFQILVVDQHAYPIVRAGGVAVGNVNDPVSLANYMNAFRNLCSNGYVEHASGQLFRLTSGGFDKAAKLSQENT